MSMNRNHYNLISSLAIFSLFVNEQRVNLLEENMTDAKPSTYIAKFEAETTDPSKTIRGTAILVDKIAHNMPMASIPVAAGWEAIKGLQLADPNFYVSSGH